MRAAVPHVLRRSNVAQAPNYRPKDLNLVPPLAAADAGALMTSSQIWLKCYGCGTRPTARLSQLSRDRPPLPTSCSVRHQSAITSNSGTTTLAFCALDTSRAITTTPCELCHHVSLTDWRCDRTVTEAVYSTGRGAVGEEKLAAFRVTELVGG